MAVFGDRPALKAGLTTLGLIVGLWLIAIMAGALGFRPFPELPFVTNAPLPASITLQGAAADDQTLAEYGLDQPPSDETADTTVPVDPAPPPTGAASPPGGPGPTLVAAAPSTSSPATSERRTGGATAANRGAGSPRPDRGGKGPENTNYGRGVSNGNGASNGTGASNGSGASNVGGPPPWAHGDAPSPGHAKTKTQGGGPPAWAHGDAPPPGHAKAPKVKKAKKAKG